MIPVNEPLILDQDLEYATEAIRTGWISSEGRFIRAFEEKFAQLVGRKHAVSVNNGTSALILALRALELPPGSEIILPSFTIISCSMACIYNDLIPVFVDCTPDTWTLDATKIEEKITPRTRAIMPVHIYGHPADMTAILAIAERHDLLIVEDFAEGIASAVGGIPCGKFGAISCASFYANKIVTTGEGGMCLTDDDAIADRLRSLKNLAFQPERRFVHNEIGFNFRMTNIQAAIGLAQTEQITEHLRRKRAMAALYGELLHPLEGKHLIQLPVENAGFLNSYWMYALVLKIETSALVVMKRMADLGVQTRPFFYPLHLQPVHRKYPWFKSESLPVTERIGDFGFYLPSGLTLTEETIREVAKQLTRALTESHDS